MTPSETHNIILIGMPGAGKSTLGVLLAKRLAMGFVDTDLLIQQGAGCTLQEIVDSHGYQGLRQREEVELLALAPASPQVIATGGSVVYSEPAMAHLRRLGPRVYLYCSLPLILQRVSNESSRGLARAPGQSLAGLYAEREPLYRAHADLTIDCDSLTTEGAVNAIVAAVSSDWQF